MFTIAESLMPHILILPDDNPDAQDPQKDNGNVQPSAPKNNDGENDDSKYFTLYLNYTCN